jgi:hypothetical protein
VTSRGPFCATCCDHNYGQPAASGRARLERNGQLYNAANVENGTLAMMTGATDDRMLAQAAGSYRERPVEGVLQDHFACVWVHQLPRPDVQPVVIVPDGCIDLEWIDGALRIAGPDRAPKIERLAAGATVVGFRFRPAMAAAWLGRFRRGHRTCARRSRCSRPARRPAKR